MAINMRVAWSNFQVVRVWGLLGHVANMARISPVANRRAPAAAPNVPLGTAVMSLA